MQRLGDGRIAEGVGNGAFLQAGDGDDVAGFGVFQRHAVEAAEGEDLGDATRFELLARGVENLDGLVRLDRAGLDAAGDQAAKERVGLEDRADHLEGLVLAGGVRLRHVLQDQVEERGQALVLRTLRLLGHPAAAARPIEHREVELLLGGVERDEQIEDLVQHFLMALVVPVDLVDRDDRLETHFQGLAEHELGLRHRAFRSVDQNHGAVDHVEDALDLAAEIGVARRVDDVDAGVLPLHRRRLGQDRDAALLFEVVRIHRALFGPLVLAERARLGEQLVDESGLAVIDMRDDRDVAKLHKGHRKRVKAGRMDHPPGAVLPCSYSKCCRCERWAGRRHGARSRPRMCERFAQTLRAGSSVVVHNSVSSRSISRTVSASLSPSISTRPKN